MFARGTTCKPMSAKKRLCHSCATPADWQPGDDVIVPSPGSCGTAKERMEKPDPDAYALDWFMTFKKLPLEKLNLPPAAQVWK
jgi:hypothetical protein